MSLDTYQCPRCGCGARVIDVRRSPHGLRRRRMCTGCGARFTTYEREPPGWQRRPGRRTGVPVAGGRR